MIVGVDYEEFKPETYEAVVLRDGGEEIHREDGGDFLDDYRSMEEWIDENVDDLVLSSSSVQHYLIDSTKAND